MISKGTVDVNIVSLSPINLKINKAKTIEIKLPKKTINPRKILRLAIDNIMVINNSAMSVGYRAVSCMTFPISVFS